MSKITVITPTWNQGQFIEDTILSVLNQTHKDIEYLIIDNESDDETEAIVRKYLEKDKRIIYLREKDHGQAEAINKGLDRATGDIVCWLNSDDFFYDEGVLEDVNDRFEKDKELLVITGDAYYCDKEKQMTEHYLSDRGVRNFVITRWYYIVQPSTFWKRNDLRLDEKFNYVFDWKYFIQMFGMGKVSFAHKDYSVYRMYEDNKTGQDNAKRKKEIYELQKELGVSKANIAWCKHVYEVYRKAEEKGVASPKKRVDFFSRVLFHITGKRICSF